MLKVLQFYSNVMIGIRPTFFKYRKEYTTQNELGLEYSNQHSKREAVGVEDLAAYEGKTKTLRWNE